MDRHSVRCTGAASTAVRSLLLRDPFEELVDLTGPLVRDELARPVVDLVVVEAALVQRVAGCVGDLVHRLDVDDRDLLEREPCVVGLLGYQLVARHVAMVHPLARKHKAQWKRRRRARSAPVGGGSGLAVSALAATASRTSDRAWSRSASDRTRTRTQSDEPERSSIRSSSRSSVRRSRMTAFVRRTSSASGPSK